MVVSRRLLPLGGSRLLDASMLYPLGYRSQVRTGLAGAQAVTVPTVTQVATAKISMANEMRT
ncbi:hypothetical protein GCM10012320_25480 [Sinomonas cellulolyticus]|nr:hypothetical protein GCM10012320_25480 [Sinomonas sp. KCTC 49339]